MRAKHIGLTAFLLAPLVIVVILVLLIVLSIDRQNREGGHGPESAPANQLPGPHG